MLFNTLEFGLFFFVVFFLYWFVFNKSLKTQNLFLLVISYIFYGWWDWRFLFLIFFSSLTDYFVGYGLSKIDDKKRRKVLLYLSLTVNLGLLGFFKYFNFFLDNFKALFQISNENFSTLDIILPVGISFYTLQTLSYTLDVYDKKIKPTTQVIDFFAFVSFFPQLVAGPIERASKLLPQFNKKRIFKYEEATDGARQILWGLFKKMVIADNLSLYIGSNFENYSTLDGSTLLLNLCVTSFLFYCDFSGYSDIAIGTARILGFRLSKNFDFPYFARNISEFWNKWHISLISWFKDYVVRRLKGFNKIKLTRNIFIVFLLTGFWHGANWTYIVWGFVNALFFLPIIWGKRTKYRKPIAYNKLFPTFKELYLMFVVLMTFSITGIFFMVKTVPDGIEYFFRIFSLSLFNIPLLPSNYAIFGLIILFVVEWLQRTKEHGLDFTNLKLSQPIRYAIYFILIFIILTIGGEPQDFTYFQF